MVPEIWSVTDIIFCRFGPFLALLPSHNPKNLNFEKMPGDIIILYVYHKYNHMMHGSWDMEKTDKILSF